MFTLLSTEQIPRCLTRLVGQAKNTLTRYPGHDTKLNLVVGLQFRSSGKVWGTFFVVIICLWVTSRQKFQASPSDRKLVQYRLLSGFFFVDFMVKTSDVLDPQSIPLLFQIRSKTTRLKNELREMFISKSFYSYWIWIIFKTDLFDPLIEA